MSKFWVRGELRLRNARLVARREELGMSQTAFAQYLGIGVVEYNGYELMRNYPGAPRRALLARECDCTEAELFPPQLKEYAAERGGKPFVSVASIDPDRMIGTTRREVLALPGNATPESETVESETFGILDESLQGLSTRDRRILSLYFGLGENKEPRTLDEIGDVEGICRENVRRIKERALMRLRGRKLLRNQLEIAPPSEDAVMRRREWEELERKRRQRLAEQDERITRTLNG